jgi:hypothetical protein
MKKDIFIDNNIASRHFSNPTLDEYKKLIKWLMTHQKNEETDAYLVTSQALMMEYHRSNNGAHSTTNIVNIIGNLNKQGRLVRFEKKDIEDFKKKLMPDKVQKKLKCNKEDRDLIPIVLMSDRQMALSEDEHFRNDLYKIAGFNPTTASYPNDLDYENYQRE